MSENLTKALEILLFGWGGVFVVMTLIYLASKLMATLFKVKK